MHSGDGEPRPLLCMPPPPFARPGGRVKGAVKTWAPPCLQAGAHPSANHPQDAGSADAFRGVDLDFVAAAAEAAKKAGVRYVGLVSAQGANANLWAGSWKPLHPLLYSKTKGEVRRRDGAPFLDCGCLRIG